MKKNGFTLLEVIIGIAILTVAVVGVISLMSQTLTYASSNESKLVASYLAQEGLELVRNIRDNTWLSQRQNPGLQWRNDQNKLQVPKNQWAYEIDCTTSTLEDVRIEPENHDERHYLYISSATGFYYYPAAPSPTDNKTSFKRWIDIRNVAGGDDQGPFVVIVKVSWEDRGKTYNITAETVLYNWYGSD